MGRQRQVLTTGENRTKVCFTQNASNLGALVPLNLNLAVLDRATGAAGLLHGFGQLLFFRQTDADETRSNAEYDIREIATCGLSTLDEFNSFSMSPPAASTPAKSSSTARNRIGKVNCLLTDGQRLFCYRDAQGWKGLAYCTVYILGQGTHQFEDPTVKIELEGESYNRGVVVATQALNGSNWRLLDPGELLVLENGIPRFSTHREVELP